MAIYGVLLVSTISSSLVLCRDKGRVVDWVQRFGKSFVTWLTCSSMNYITAERGFLAFEDINSIW